MASGQNLRVFILAGQSNMLGHAEIEHLEQLVDDTETRDDYIHLLNQDGSWAVRDDVTLAFRNDVHKLTVGKGDTSTKFGPELQFGQVVGDYFDDPVLLIKTAWGGTDLAVDWRPPSSGIPSEPYECFLFRSCQETEYGFRFRSMVEYVEKILTDIPNTLPEYTDLNPILSGFVWFQGFNGEFRDAYMLNIHALLVILALILP